MSNQPTTTVITPKTLAGPWRSRYTVNLETLAVNLATTYCRTSEQYPEGAEACFATMLGVWSDLNLPTSPTQPNDRSIAGFWLARYNELNDSQLHAVMDRAVAICNHPSLDPYEMFDGQF